MSFTVEFEAFNSAQAACFTFLLILFLLFHQRVIRIWCFKGHYMENIKSSALRSVFFYCQTFKRVILTRC